MSEDLPPNPLPTSANAFNDSYFFSKSDLLDYNTADDRYIRIGSIGNVNKLLVGDSTDTGRMISCLNGSMTVGQYASLTLGKANQSGDQLELQFKYNAPNDNANKILLGFYGKISMTISKDDKVSFGPTEGALIGLNVLNVNNPSIRLGKQQSINDCVSMSWTHSSDGSADNALAWNWFGTSNALVLSKNGLAVGAARQNIAKLEVYGTNSYAYSSMKFYNVSNDTYSTVSNSSVNLSISAADGSIYCNNSICTASDRRIKHDIQDYDFDMKAYKMLRPTIYRKNNNPDKQEIGLVAQECLKCGLVDVLTMVPNAELKKESEYDPEDGVQLSIEYDRLSVVNMVIIKKLIERIEVLEKKKKI